MPDVETGEGVVKAGSGGGGKDASPFRQPRARPLASTDGGRMSNASGSLEACGFLPLLLPRPRVDIYPPQLRPCRHRLARPSAQRGYTRGRQGQAGPGTGLELSCLILAAHPGRRVPGPWAGAGEKGGDGGGGLESLFQSNTPNSFEP